VKGMTHPCLLKRCSSKFFAVNCRLDSFDYQITANSNRSDRDHSAQQ
jgi:hypothetical protein